MVLNHIDQNHLITQAFYHDSCLQRGNKMIKNLKLLQRNLTDIIIIDDNPSSYILQKANGIPISSWKGDQGDTMLDQLKNILIYLSSVNDVREYIPLFVKENMINFEEINKILNYPNSNSSTISQIDFNTPVSLKDSNKNITHPNEENLIIDRKIPDNASTSATQKKNQNNDELSLDNFNPKSKLSNENKKKSRNISKINEILSIDLEVSQKYSNLSKMKKDKNHIYIPVFSIRLCKAMENLKERKIENLQSEELSKRIQSDQLNQKKDKNYFKRNHILSGDMVHPKKTKKYINEEYLADVSRIHQKMKCKTIEDVRKEFP